MFICNVASRSVNDVYVRIRECEYSLVAESYSFVESCQHLVSFIFGWLSTLTVASRFSKDINVKTDLRNKVLMTLLNSITCENISVFYILKMEVAYRFWCLRNSTYK